MGAEETFCLQVTGAYRQIPQKNVHGYCLTLVGCRLQRSSARYCQESHDFRRHSTQHEASSNAAQLDRVVRHRVATPPCCSAIASHETIVEARNQELKSFHRCVADSSRLGLFVAAAVVEFQERDGRDLTESFPFRVETADFFCLHSYRFHHCSHYYYYCCSFGHTVPRRNAVNQQLSESLQSIHDHFRLHSSFLRRASSADEKMNQAVDHREF